MASFNDPKITNQIASDVPAIQQLLSYLAQARPDFGTNYPTGSLRIVQLQSNSVWYIQVFKDGSWDNCGTFYLNATSVRGYEPSTSAAAGKIPVYNSSGQLVGNITGTAATATKLATPRSIQVGGIASSTAQNFDGSANVTIPINQITVNNSADNAINGIVSKAHGGTGRNDGAAADVVVNGVSGAMLASSVGQIGDVISKGDCDFNTLVNTGYYSVNCATGMAHHQPRLINVTGRMRVTRWSTHIYQLLYLTTPEMWIRRSIDTGASWDSWLPLGGHLPAITIYLSKSGSDLNTGLESAYPVQTIARAFQIADGLCRGTTSNQAVFCFGAGNWGDIHIYSKPYFVYLYPYDSAKPTAYSTSLPVFGVIDACSSCVILRGVIAAGNVVSQRNSSVFVDSGYKRMCRLVAYSYGYLAFISENVATNLLEVNPPATQSTACLDAYEGGFIDCQGYLNIKLIANCTTNYGMVRAVNYGHIYLSKSVTFVSTTYKITGPKYTLYAGSSFTNEDNSKALPANLNAIPATQNPSVQNGAVINGYVYGQANDADVVHKSGDTMTGDLTIQKGAPSYILKNTSDTYNIAPTANANSSVALYDKNNVTNGTVLFTHEPTGRMCGTLRVKGHDSSWALLQIYCEPDGTKYGIVSTPSASANNTYIPTTAWVRTLVASNSANEVPIGTVCAYEGTFTRAIDAAVFFEKEIKSLSESLKNEQQAARMMRQTRSADDDMGLMFELQEIEDKIFKLEYWKEFYREMLSRVPESDGVTLYNAEGNPIDETVAYPEFQIMGRAFPNTKWNQYSPGARVLIGTDTKHAYGTTGGAETHAHGMSGSVSDSTLLLTHIPSHTHTITAYNPATSSTHVGWGGGTSYTNVSSGSAGSSDAHGHGNTFAIGNASSYPPYKAVYWIKKVA